VEAFADGSERPQHAASPALASTDLPRTLTAYPRSAYGSYVQKTTTAVVSLRHSRRRSGFPASSHRVLIGMVLHRWATRRTPWRAS
jgi:hypothetical protein